MGPVFQTQKGTEASVGGQRPDLKTHMWKTPVPNFPRPARFQTGEPHWHGTRKGKEILLQTRPGFQETPLQWPPCSGGSEPSPLHPWSEEASRTGQAISGQTGKTLFPN